MTMDPTKPHIGRVYDFMLGGNHNFEVDRQVAANLIAHLPSYPKWARMNRWFIQLVASQWLDEGYHDVLDLASGLPTQGHLHTQMPEARILYSDNDPISVTYGREILQGADKTEYIQADLREPQTVITAAAAHFGTQPRIAIGAIGIIYFLTDPQLQQLAGMLHAWSASGSNMAVSFPQLVITPESAVFAENFQRQMEKLGVTVYYRTPDETAALLRPWNVLTWRGLEEWMGLESSITDEDRVGNVFSMYGMILDH